MFARCVQGVCNKCARYVKDMCKMCARCVHTSCLISLNPTHLEKIILCWVLQISEKHCGILKKFVHACVVNVNHAKVLPGSVEH